MPAEKEKLKGEYTGRWNARFTLTLINNKKKRIFKRGFKSKKEQLKIGFFPTLSMLYNNYTNNVLHRV